MTFHALPSGTGDATHVEFRLTGDESPTVALSGASGCEVELEATLPRLAGGYRGFYGVRGHLRAAERKLFDFLLE